MRIRRADGGGSSFQNSTRDCSGMEGSRTARTTGQVFGGMMRLTGDCHVQGPECGNMHWFCMATKLVSVLGLYVSSANFE